MKTCRRCGIEKTTEEFSKNRNTKTGLQVYCKTCVSKYAADHYKRFPEKHKQQGRAYYAREKEHHRAFMSKYYHNMKASDPERFDKVYGRKGVLRKQHLTEEQYVLLLEGQGSKCAVCLTETPTGFGGWHIDHDHQCCPRYGSCGKCVRGLLCSRCNQALGLLLDNPATLARAIEYLKNPPAQKFLNPFPEPSV